MEIQIDLDREIYMLLNQVRHMAKQVFTGLGKGYSEAIYQRALCIELQQARMEYDIETCVPVKYKDHVVGNVRTDIIIRGRNPLVIETKTIRFFRPEERWQLTRYMKLLGIDVGVLINFMDGPQLEYIVCCDDEFYIYDMRAGTGKLLR